MLIYPNQFPSHTQAPLWACSLLHLFHKLSNMMPHINQSFTSPSGISTAEMCSIVLVYETTNTPQSTPVAHNYITWSTSISVLLATDSFTWAVSQHAAIKKWNTGLLSTQTFCAWDPLSSQPYSRLSGEKYSFTHFPIIPSIAFAPSCKILFKHLHVEKGAKPKTVDWKDLMNWRSPLEKKRNVFRYLQPSPASLNSNFPG